MNMKNQYSFTTTSKAAEQQNVSAAAPRSSLSKLHNLVAAKFAPIEQSGAAASSRLKLAPSNPTALRTSKPLMALKMAPLMNETTTSNGSSNSKHLKQAATNSERAQPELAKCYDEIDQIYDYIRGLAPLPLQLRKIKSIDFEQMERDRRIQLARAAQARAQPAPSSAWSASSSSASLTANNRLVKSPAKARQREANGEETTAPPPRVQGPLTVRVATSESQPMAVKRVESLNLGHSSTNESIGSPQKVPTKKDPSASQEAVVKSRLFRLPRAHSTSTLNNKAQRHLKEVKSATETVPEGTTRTLPAVRPRGQRDPRDSPSRLPLDLVESFVDEEESTSSSSSDGGDEGSLAAAAAASNHKVVKTRWTEKSHSDYENDTVSPSGSSSSCASTRRSSRRHRSSSGAGTATNSQQRSSSSASSSSDSSDEDEEVEPATRRKEEHIYEQIPAHKNLIAMGASKEPPFNYPLAYAPNVAMTQQQRLLAAPSDRRARLSAGLSAHNLSGGTGATYPHLRQPPKASLQRCTLMSPSMKLTPNRLSMSNLHHPPPAYLSQHPMLASHFHQHQHRQVIKNHQNRQQQPHGVEEDNKAMARSSSSSRLNRAPRLSPAQLIAQIQMPRAVSKRQVSETSSARPLTGQYAGGSQFAPIDASAEPSKPVGGGAWHQQVRQFQRWLAPTTTAPSSTSQRSSSKRHSTRRLTAIGIEAGDALNRHQPSERAEVSSQASRPQSGFLNDDLPATATTPTTKQQASFMLGRCLNSISDLHSFSSKSSATGSSSSLQSSKASSSSTNDVEEDGDDDEQDTKNCQVLPAKSCPKLKGDKSFVSSRSFIKCYYGREKVACDIKDHFPKPESKQPARVKKRGNGGKLLGLIGLNTGGNRGASVEKVGNESKQVSLKWPQSSCGSRSETEGFLTTEGPILVRDRRIAALRSDLVRHYQHPTVQVSEVPSSGQLLATRTDNSSGNTNTTNSTSSYEAAIKNSAENDKSVALEAGAQKTSMTMSQWHNNHKTQSSSSSAQKQPPSSQNHKANHNQLIKVPKLCRRSHLLNRPLPKPPANPYKLNLDHLSERKRISSGAQLQQAHRIMAPTTTLSNPAIGNKRRSLQVEEVKLVGTQTAQTTPKPANGKLAPLSLSIRDTQNVQASPAATTTGTSSGISSRLTSGTQHQLSGSSLQRTTPQNRIKSLSELHKQRSKQQQAADAHTRSKQDSGLASDKTLAKEQQAESSPSPDGGGKQLRLFDERFSAKFLDKQLASSSDSLLESINFSGGGNQSLNRKSADVASGLRPARAR